MTECTGGWKDLAKRLAHARPSKCGCGGIASSFCSSHTLAFLYPPHQRDSFSSPHSLLYRDTNSFCHLVSVSRGRGQEIAEGQGPTHPPAPPRAPGP